jgi:hypothetical protein
MTDKSPSQANAVASIVERRSGQADPIGRADRAVVF